MILKALYDYYNRCGNLPVYGMEEKQIGFLIVIDDHGRFIRIEDCRINKNTAKSFLVKKSVGRTSAPMANYLYDSSTYVFGYSDKKSGKEQLYFDTFKKKVKSIAHSFPGNKDLNALMGFYQHSREELLNKMMKDPLWDDITKSLSKKYSVFSFRLEGDTKIVAEKKELLQLEDNELDDAKEMLCIIKGMRGPVVETTTATMIPGSQATAKLVGGNAPISEEAEFKYTTALNRLLAKNSHNKFMLGNRTFVFWASSSSEASKDVEDGLFSLLGYTSENIDNPNAKIEQVRKVFKSIYSGELKTDLNDRFYILGLAPNAARIAVVYWSDTSLKDFAGNIERHFGDMEIADTSKNKKSYMGLYEMLSAVTRGGKVSDATPNLPEAVAKSIFQGLPYPFTLFSSCLRRIKAEGGDLPIARAAIIKAYLNRLNDTPNKKISIMLDKDNQNQGYLCGRLFAVLDKIQEDANGIHSIRERYMNAASTTPASVFATILNLSSHHAENLSSDGRRVFYEKLKQEIMSKISADGFPAHLDLQDQGRFFVGYYHQRQDFFARKTENNNE